MITYIYDNIFNLGSQIYFLSESRIYRVTRIARILRGCLLVGGVPCLNPDLLDWRIFRIIDLVGLPIVGCAGFLQHILLDYAYASGNLIPKILSVATCVKIGRFRRNLYMFAESQ